jgi:hypothetical protein
MAIIDMQVTIEPKIKRSRTLGRLELQAELGEAMRHTNYSHLADRLLTCHRKYFRHKRCDRGHDWASAQDSCGLRICPHCSARRAQVLAGRFERLLDDKQDQRYAVFAERNVDQGCLDQGISSLWRSWARLRHSPQWKAKVRGCLAVLEVTYNQQENTWHPHLNVLMEGDYFPFEELNQAWVAATGGRGHTSFIGAADAGTIRELIK